MKRSTARFLTTHTGSLPRPDDLVRMMYAREEGIPVIPGEDLDEGIEKALEVLVAYLEAQGQRLEEAHA